MHFYEYLYITVNEEIPLGSFVGCSQYTTNLLYMCIFSIRHIDYMFRPLYILGHHQVPQLIALLTYNASSDTANFLGNKTLYYGNFLSVSICNIFHNNIYSYQCFGFLFA
jgi:hypothetical protein